MAKRGKGPTIYDVASLAGVSVATVSRVLNEPGRVRQQTRDRVLSAVDELQFVPRADAIARARQRFGRIGVLTPFFTAPSFVQRMRGVATSIASSRYELIVYTVQTAAHLDEYLTVLPLAHRVDGLIVMSLPLRDQAARRLVESGLETVCIEYHNDRFSTVEIDNQEGGRLAARYLLGKGYKKPAVIGETGEPDYALHPAIGRLGGFREVCEAAGVELPGERIRLNPYGAETVAAEVERLLELPERPDAIFATSDLQAVAVLKTARRRGLSVPGDLAVLGFDNTDLADYLDLSTVDQGLDASGRIALELVLRQMEGNTRPVQRVRLRLEVAERSSA